MQRPLFGLLLLFSMGIGFNAHAGKEELKALLSSTAGGINIQAGEASKWLFKRTSADLQDDGKTKYVGNLTKIIGVEDTLSNLQFLSPEKIVTEEFQRLLTEVFTDITNDFRDVFHIRFYVKKDNLSKVAFVVKITNLSQEDAAKIASTLSGDNSMVGIADELF